MKHCTDLNCSFELKSEDDDEVASFTGIASTSETDLQNDVIMPGAFDPIRMRMAPTGLEIPDVMMLRDHDRTQVIGGWKRFEQRGGELYVEGELALEVEKGRETYALMRKGYLSGLSVGFEAHRKDIAMPELGGPRRIKKAVLKECSIVCYPANTGARVVQVKSELDDWLVEHGIYEEDIEQLSALLGVDNDKEAEIDGDVSYADPGYRDGVKRYPINNETRIKAAWNYIHKTPNRKFYSSAQLKRIEARIIAAWRQRIDKDGPPAAQEDEAPPFFSEQQHNAATLLRGLVQQLKGRGYAV